MNIKDIPDTLEKMQEFHEVSKSQEKVEKRATLPNIS